MGIVYCYTNVLNNKKYIGYTEDEKTRRHCWDSLKSYAGPHINNARKKYPKDVWHYEVLKYNAAPEDERYYIELYDTTNKEKGYNIASGGIGGAKGIHRTKEQRYRYRLSKLGDKNPMYGKKQDNNWCKGLTKDTDERIKSATEKRMKTLNGFVPFKGHKHTEEAKRENSKKHLGNKNASGKRSADFCRRNREMFLGRKWVNNGINSKLVKEQDIDLFLNKGWSLGRAKFKKTK